MACKYCRPLISSYNRTNSHLEDSTMKTTVYYLDKIKKVEKLGSDYALAKLIGITQSAISRYRKQISFMDDYTAVKVAKILNIDPLEIISTANAERAKTDEEKKVWKDISKNLRSAVASIAIVVFAISTVVSDPIFAAGHYILC